MLSNARIRARGVSPHLHEQQAIDFVIRTLPDRDPLQLWALVDLVDNSGRRYDLDLVVLGYHALYLIEIKSHPGRFSGDAVDWKVDFHDGGTARMENPLRLTAHKARVLASQLQRKLGPERPFVQELVFLSAPDAELAFRHGDSNLIVTRDTFERAITFGEFPGVPPRLLSQRVNRPLAQRTVDALQKIGLRDSIASKKVGDLVLGDVMLERQNYQDHFARNERLREESARVRTYQVAQGTTEERRGHIVRAAEREARMLSMLSDHPSILRLKSYVAEGPTGAPCVVFDDFAGSLPLDAFLRAHDRELSFDDRIGLLQSLAEALGYCHGKGVLHRGLAPSAVLVRRNGDSGKLELRLFNFQLASATEATSSGTHHLDPWIARSEDVYVAPEVLERPSLASRASDVFSLGAIAYLVLTGRPPGESLAERERLMQPGYLSLAMSADQFAPGLLAPDGNNRADLETAMQLATARAAIDRYEDPVAWVDELVDALTAPQPAAPEPIDPLTARKGDEIAPGMRVEAVLGTGSTARTLRVKLGDSLFALKVALSADQDERVRREGKILAQLDSDRIVRLYDTLTLAGRTCLRMTDAGETLAKVLAERGVPSLDFARRWGDDLLHALVHLEERGIQHRDIKPGNLGVIEREQKKRRHLFLFDFSLSSADPKDLGAGTPLYRDPFLYQRGHWDDAADRYAAAITLHELLTGDRPRWGQDDVASATDAPITLAAERFDPSVRERLVAFFDRALHRTLQERFATAEEMRTEWAACFARRPEPATLPEDEADPEPAQAPLPTGLALDTPASALPLPARAKNALDRAGVLSVRALLALPNNQLSSMRGVGRGTWRDIRALLERPELVALRAQLAPPEPEPREDEGATLLQRWIERFLPSARKRGDKPLAHVRVLFRLDPAPSGRCVDSVADAARALSVTRALIYADLGKLRERWAQAPELTELTEKVTALLDAAFGVAPLDELGLVLARELGAPLAAATETSAAGAPSPSDCTGAHTADLRAARALARIAVELHAEFKLARVGGTLWVLPEALDPKPLAALGALADDLARADPLLSPGAVEERLRARVHELAGAGSALAQLPTHRLLSVAALAGTIAQKSARLELYPRGLSCVRALDLCVAALPPSKLSPELLRDIVRARYPAAEPLPQGAELRALMRARGYGWDGASQTFERERPRLDPSTEAPLPRQHTAHTPHRTAPDPDAHQFARDIEVRHKRGSFCVLEVKPRRAAEAARELQHRLGVAPLSLERELLAELRAQIAAHEIEPDIVYATDRDGRAGAEWPNLRDLMKLAAAGLLARLSAANAPLLLTDPGLLARYELHDFVRGLIEHGRKDDAPAVFLIVPASDELGGPRISHPDGDLALPLISQAQRLRIPDAFIENRDRA